MDTLCNNDPISYKEFEICDHNFFYYFNAKLNKMSVK
jgi:hypothetical protein